ncbi:MAG: hypothetical protein QOE62_1136 [Actinomycetota bacterium]|jgi:hypothetical protein|nr:hypothetical protein [Actinomycetota bacterium]
MTLEVKPGTKLRSAVCSTEVIVVRAPAEPVDLRCGGRALVTDSAPAAPAAEPEPGFDDGTKLGKRYTDADKSFELLCTKAGRGSLSLGLVVLQLSGAKPLPASD